MPFFNPKPLCILFILLNSAFKCTVKGICATTSDGTNMKFGTKFIFGPPPVDAQATLMNYP